ncbi:hypothetical protein [Empedobacter falsenii]|uniref:Lipoprotein n=1 Tax=Empedobacter falsenii TaxID=343874 RepID=A0A7H9DQM7_9FLAO|nr:hypothetical protein [Empedobacter falsenii]QLL57246.1 hypothetical protein FH779_03705 [Empedobacter falsenii]
MKKIIFIFLVSSIFMSCKKKEIIKAEITKNDTIDMFNIELIKKHLKLQEKIELPEDDMDIYHVYKLTDIDLDLGGQVTRKGLINNGYKIPSQDEFQKKINAIFHISINEKDNENTIPHDNFITYLIPSTTSEDKTLRQTEYDYTYNHLFFFYNYGFITELPLLGDIIKINNDNSYQIDLPHNIIARNKYLFNDSKGDLAWLLFNDKEFLKTLLVTFNYDKEPKITKMVLENYDYDDVKLFHDLIFDKIKNKYRIRENILKDIEEIIYNGKTNELLSPAKEGNGYDSLSEIIEKIYNNPDSYIDSNKIIALLMEKSLDVGNLGISQEFLRNHDEYKRELEKNNYYNYERLKIFCENLSAF